jgi:hypothetical protein
VFLLPKATDRAAIVEVPLRDSRRFDLRRL